MKPIIFELIISCLLILLGLFLDKIFRFFLSENKVEVYFVYLKYSQIALLVAGVILFVLAVVVVIFPALGDIADIIRIAALTIVAIALITGWICLSKGVRFQGFIIAYLLLFLVVSGYALIKTTSFNKADGFTLTPDSLKIGGDYELVIPLSSISNVSVREGMPNISLRTNGIAFMNVRKGYFELADGTTCFLNINNYKSTSVIEIDRKGDIPVYVNCETPEETLSLHNRIVQKMQGGD